MQKKGSWGKQKRQTMTLSPKMLNDNRSRFDLFGDFAAFHRSTWELLVQDLDNVKTKFHAFTYCKRKLHAYCSWTHTCCTIGRIFFFFHTFMWMWMIIWNLLSDRSSPLNPCCHNVASPPLSYYKIWMHEIQTLWFKNKSRKKKKKENLEDVPGVGLKKCYEGSLHKNFRSFNFVNHKATLTFHKSSGEKLQYRHEKYRNTF